MTVVVDASVIVAALVDDGPDGRWAERLLADDLAAPHLLHVETANVLRRAAIAGHISQHPRVLIDPPAVSSAEAGVPTLRCVERGTGR